MRTALRRLQIGCASQPTDFRLGLSGHSRRRRLLLATFQTFRDSLTMSAYQDKADIPPSGWHFRFLTRNGHLDSTPLCQDTG